MSITTLPVVGWMDGVKRLVGCAWLAVVVTLLAACAAPPTGLAPSTGGAQSDHAETAAYQIAIDQPDLMNNERVLAQALRFDADKIRREFVASVAETRQIPEYASRRFELILDCRQITRVSVLTSVVCSGMENTGGAHPIPLDFSKVFDTRTQCVLALADLFVDPQAALDGLARYARGELVQRLTQASDLDDATPQARRDALDNIRKMVEQGTEPNADNFASFAVTRASGIVLIFPRYQVAPYVAGVQTVQVPPAVFADGLRPEYRAVFGP